MATQAMSQISIGSTSRVESFRDHNRALYDAQKRARRGPTPEVFFAKRLDNSRLRKADDPQRQREIRSFAVVMGFVFLFVIAYVFQHFSAIDYGYKIEATKVQVEKLEEENRALHLQEAQLSDPKRIDMIAKQLGLDVPQPGQVVQSNGMDPNAPVMAQTAAPAQLGQ